MMRGLASLALLGGGFARAGSSHSHCGAFPTLMWAGRDYLGGQHRSYEFMGTSHEETARAVHGMRDRKDGPEVAVVFVLPSSFHDHHLSKESFPSVHSIVTGAPSSKVLPCVTRSSSSASSLVDVYSLSTPASESVAVRPHQLKSHILASRATGSAGSGRLKVLVSSLAEGASPAEVDMLVSEVSEALASTVPEGRYLVVQAPEPHAGQPALGAHIPRRVLLVTDDDDKKAYYPKTYLYATPNLVAGLLTGVFMLAVLYVGVQCLLALQTPTKFIRDKIPEGKQY